MRNAIETANEIVEVLERHKKIYAGVLLKLLMADDKLLEEVLEHQESGDYAEGWADGVIRGQRISFLRGRAQGRAEENARIRQDMKAEYERGERVGMAKGIAWERDRLVNKMKGKGISKEQIEEIISKGAV
jgi:hypothetical protein